MARGMPSMLALLGLLAVAGYQNRDKIAEALGSRGGPRPSGPGQPGGSSGGLLGDLFGGGAGVGSVLSGGLGEIVDRFKQAGHGEAADSWVSKGPNKPVSSDELERAIGSDTLDELSQRTGLSRQELLERLSRDLPAAVDKFTPEGRIPSESEAAKLI
jgi:uncharacterized protein YidB (DUF937 family)